MTEAGEDVFEVQVNKITKGSPAEIMGLAAGAVALYERALAIAIAHGFPEERRDNAALAMMVQAILNIVPEQHLFEALPGLGGGLGGWMFAVGIAPRSAGHVAELTAASARLSYEELVEQIGAPGTVGGRA